MSGGSWVQSPVWPSFLFNTYCGIFQAWCQTISRSEYVHVVLDPNYLTYWNSHKFAMQRSALDPCWKCQWRKTHQIKHATIGRQTSTILSGKLPDMHLSQAWLISLLDGLCKAIWCTLNSPSMKGATWTVNKSEKYPLLPSLNLQTQLYLGSSNWLDISNTAEMFLNLTLSLIHPELFKWGSWCFKSFDIWKQLRMLHGNGNLSTLALQL